MSIEDKIKLLESSPSKSTTLFYYTASKLLKQVGFKLVDDFYIVCSHNFVDEKFSPKQISDLISNSENFKNVKFVEIFGRHDMSHIAAMVSYKDIYDFMGKTFDYYVITSNSDLGSDLKACVRDVLSYVNANRFVDRDFNEGFVTKVDDMYYFTLNSLLYAVKNSKPVLRPHYVYES